MDSLWKDVRYAARSLRRTPGFTLVAVVTIALAIGANTAIFSVVRTVLLRPLPYEDADRLVLVWTQLRNRNVTHFGSAPPVLEDMRRQTELFESIAGVVSFPQALTGEGEPEQIRVGGVTPNFFSTLGVRPALGRDFVEADGFAGVDAAEQPAPQAFEPPAVVILSHELWRTHFGSDPSVLGRTIELGGESVEVIGVMPGGFELLMPPESNMARSVDVWAALRLNVDDWPSRANALWEVMGRLRPGTTVAQAQAEMDRFAAGQRAQDNLFGTAGYAIEVAPMQRDLTEHVRPVVMALLGAVGFLLLIACGNVANLLLVRSSAREREIAVRAALGATRGRLARQLFVESALLAVAGAVLGLALAQAGIELLLALQPEDVPRLESIAIDGLVLAFTVGATALAALVFGAIPALQSTRPQLVGALKDRGRTGAAAAQKRLRNAVVVFEVALSLVLLIAAGLMLRSFMELRQADPGFRPQGVLTFEIPLPAARYPTARDRATMMTRLQSSLEAVPGVASASFGGPLPLAGIDINGRYGTAEALADESRFKQAAYRVVLPDYFEVMGTPLLAGRTFTRADQADSAAVIVVDQKLARAVWPDESAVGQRLLVRITTPEPEWVEVIGVVGHQRADSPATDSRETIYFTDRYASFGLGNWVVRATVPPSSLVGQIRGRVADLDPLLPVAGVQTMDDLVAASMAPTRFALVLIGIFAAMALVLASVGLYGVLAYVVRQRTGEIGVRMAFGAQTRRIIVQVVGQGMRLAAAGVALGLVAAFGATRIMASLLVGVEPRDPITFAGISLLFLMVAALATYLPARRAARVDPMVALREE